MVQLRLVDQIPPPGAPQFTEAEVAALQRAVIRLFTLWELSDHEASTLLGDISPRTFQRWKQGQYGRFGPDLAARLSNLIGIHKALRLCLDPQTQCGLW